MSFRISNFGRSTLAQPTPASGTGSDTLTIQASHGGRFPVVAAPNYTKLILADSAGTYEVVYVTAHVAEATTFTITRAQEGTIARDWPATTTAVYNSLTALEIETMIDNLAAHIAAATAAHAASAIAYTPVSGNAAVTVQGGITNATFPAGTRLVFQQSNLPTGWTRETGAAYSDATMRCMTGTVGTGGTLAWASSPMWGGTLNTSSVAITTAQMPTHSHGGATGYANTDHTHTFSGVTGTENQNHTHNEQGTSGVGVGYAGSSGGYAVATLTSGVENQAHNHNFSGTTSGFSVNHLHGITAEGNGQGHAHTWGNMQLKYVDFAIGIKS